MIRSTRTLLAALALALPAAAQGGGEVELLEELRQRERIPGLAFAVLVDGELRMAGGVGLADLELGVPATTEKRFRVGSVSKLFTATLTARLAEKGAVDLDASVRDALDWLPDAYTDVTLRLLLGHLGGVRHYGAKDYDARAPGGIIDLRLYPSTEDALALFVEDPLVAPPGERYSYTTFGFTLIAAALEAWTETPFLELLEREVTGPLGLDTVGPDRFDALVPNRTGFYELRDGEVVPAVPLNPAYKWAGGGLLATAGDVARFGAAHFEPGFLRAETLGEMFTPQTTKGGEALAVGLGWRVGTDSAGRPIVHHAGAQGGCRAVLVVWRDERVAAALLSNLTRTPGDVLAVAERLAAPHLE